VLSVGCWLACATPAPAPPPSVYRAPDPSAAERYCAWYGAEEDDVLYFGEAAFWSSYRRAGGDPRADLAAAGPRRIGRFDLEARRLLTPFDVGAPESRSGVWDVLPLDGRVYFTTYFEDAGFVELSDGSVTILADTRSWNEVSRGPAGRLLVSRYGDATGGGGAVLEVSRDGEVLAEHRLEAPEGVTLAAKSPAWDPVANEIWVTTDRLPLPAAGDDSAAFPRPTLVLDRSSGAEVARIGTAERPIEIQFVRFEIDGRGYLSVSEGGELSLVMLSPESDRRHWTTARRVLLDDHFAAALDFAQDIQPGPDGSVIVTRWSGAVHRVEADGRVRTWSLPQADGSLYYTAVATGDGVCATRCGDVEVVCAPDAAARDGRKR